MSEIYLIGFAWWFTAFEPIQLFFDKIAFILIAKTSGTTRELVNLIHSALGCPKCVGFWVSLAWGFPTALIVSFSANLIDVCLQKLKSR